MKLEERVSRALHEQADRVDVDLQRLYAGTRARTASTPRPRLRPVLGAVAATTALVLGGVAVATWGDGVRVGQPAGSEPAEGGVDTEFSCAQQRSFDFADPPPGQDDEFLPSVDRGPAAAARDVGAPRYEYVEDGGTATLWMGNSDGSLANVSTFTRVDGEWLRESATRCLGSADSIVAEDGRSLLLGEHGVTPWPADKMLDPRYTTGEPVLVDDRPYYDVAGLMAHRSIYAAPCQRGVCWAAGNPTSMMVDDRPVRADLKPVDVSDLFLPPDEMVGKNNPFGLWALYDPAARINGLSLEAADGTVIRADELRGPDWDGTLFVVLARFDDVAAVTVHPRGGETSRYRPDELPGHEPRRST